jgi:hypothetical protein
MLNRLYFKIFKYINLLIIILRAIRNTQILNEINVENMAPIIAFKIG